MSESAGDRPQDESEDDEETPLLQLPTDVPDAPETPEHVPDDWLDPKPFDPAGR